VTVSRDCPNFLGTPYYLRNEKRYGFQIWPVYSESPSEQNPIKIFRKKNVGVSRDCPILSGTPYYLRNGKSYGFQFWPVHSEGPSEQKPIKNFREKGAWAYPGTDLSFWVTPIISGTGKVTDFKFGQYIQRVHLNKGP